MCEVETGKACQPSIIQQRAKGTARKLLGWNRFRKISFAMLVCQFLLEF